MTKLTSLLFALFITGCAFDEPAPIESPATPSLVDVSWDHGMDLQVIEETSSNTCTPGSFLGCTDGLHEAYCSDDGRGIDVVECEVGCDASGCTSTDR